MTINDPRRPGEQYYNGNNRMGWATAGLVAVGLFGFVWGLSSSDTSDPLGTTGQGNSAASPGIAPVLRLIPAAPTTSNLYWLLRSASVDFMRE